MGYYYATFAGIQLVTTMVFAVATLTTGPRWLVFPAWASGGFTGVLVVLAANHV